MKWDQIASILRHILTFGGGFVVAKGWISAEALPGVVGALVTIAGVIWGVVNKSDTSVIASAAAIPGTVVVTTPALAASVPAENAVSSTTNTVVPK